MIFTPLIIVGLVVGGGILMSRKAKATAKKKKRYDFPAAFPEEWDGRTVDLKPDRKYALPGEAAADMGYETMTIQEWEMLDNGGRATTEPLLVFGAEDMPHLTVADTDDLAVICYAGPGLPTLCIEVVAREGDEQKRLPPGELPELDIAADCSEWDMSEEWIIEVGRPKFAAAVAYAFTGYGEDEPVLIDPIYVTHVVLEGELGDCPAPHKYFTQMSPDLPSDDPNYYEHDVILGLYGHVYEAVDYALNVISETGDPNAATIFEIIED